MTDQPAPGEQPDQASTAQQQAWSAAQQYPFHPAQQHPSGHAYGPSPYGPGPYQQGGYDQGAYGQGAYGQGAYGQGAYGQPTRVLPAGSYPTGEQPGQYGYQPGQYGYQPGQYGGGAFPPGPDYWAPPALPPRNHPHRLLYGSVAAAVATALAIGGIALAVDHANGNSSQQTSLSTPNQQNPFGGNGGLGNGGLGNGGLGNGNGGNSGSGSGSSGAGTTGVATTAQQVGIVDINSTIDYDQGKAAGTGIVLSSDGEVLTNNHVVQGSTSLSVTVVSTGKTYSATVVGTDPTDDVAVIQLKDASGMATAKLGDSSKVTAGTAVTAVGNAGGTGGTPTAATGSVSAINQTITASDDNGSNAERLTGMIQVNANIQPGDSGGPLYENAGGTVIGMDTAASTSSGRFGYTAGTTGFAIPIAKATSIAGQIESGTATSTIHIGYPAFLGVQLSGSASLQTGGATITGVVSGSAAARAGLGAGDTITAVDGKAVSSPSTLSSIMATHRPGDQVKLSYTTSSGQSQTVTLTLGQGPAD